MRIINHSSKFLQRQSGAVKESTPRSDLKAEIEQLEDKRIQLDDKIEGLHSKTKDKLGFHVLFEAFSKLNKKQNDGLYHVQRIED